MLALLLLNGATPMAALGALLWPDKAGDKPRNKLRGLLTHLRVLAGGDLCTGMTVLALADGVTHDLESEPAASTRLLAHNDYSDLDDFEQWLLSIREKRRQLALSELGLPADALQGPGPLTRSDRHRRTNAGSGARR